MIYNVTMFAAKCDNCGKEWSSEYYGYTAYNDEQHLEEILVDDDWYSGDTENNEGKDGEHYCPDCYSHDEEDVFHLKSIDKP